jgi:hypothetical protein
MSFNDLRLYSPTYYDTVLIVATKFAHHMDNNTSVAYKFNLIINYPFATSFVKEIN